ncbi:MAG: hypothetical protein DRO88_04545 [Promethearchaeia archaeon]|nr:MAG: hypothetical protein DRO88_04545 [Candidatus Lokiarchaeia archaeon]
MKSRKKILLTIFCFFAIISFVTTTSANIGVSVDQTYLFQGRMDWRNADKPQILTWETEIIITAVEELTINYTIIKSNVVETGGCESGAKEYNHTDVRAMIYSDDALTNDSILHFRLSNAYQINTYFINKDFAPKTLEHHGSDILMGNYTLKVSYDSNGVIETYNWIDTSEFNRNTTIERNTNSDGFTLDAYPLLIIGVAIYIGFLLIIKKSRYQKPTN